MSKQASFSYSELIDCAKGLLFGKGNAQLPLPPMLMFDRITSITDSGGLFDALWQLLGFFLGWKGFKGKAARAAGKSSSTARCFRPRRKSSTNCRSSA